MPSLLFEIHFLREASIDRESQKCTIVIPASVAMANSTNIPFVYRIRCIGPNYEAQEEQCFSNGYWKPPTRRNAYNTTSNTGWVCWSPSSCTPPPPGSQLIRYDSVSMFWCSDRQGFLVVPYDCTAESVRQKARDNALDDWRRLRFEHVEQVDGSCISLVREYEQYHGVGAPASPAWMPELLPFAYSFPPNQTSEFAFSSLGGRLSILLALAVFSRNPNTMSPVDTIRNHFRPLGAPGWRPHNTAEQNNAST